jgi:hypothetical protein
LDNRLGDRDEGAEFHAEYGGQLKTGVLRAFSGKKHRNPAALDGILNISAAQVKYVDRFIAHWSTINRAMNCPALTVRYP